MSTIPEEVKDVVTFIFIKDSSDKLKPNGTGFLVGVKDEKSKGRSFPYLVTAKHVILDPSGQYYSDFFVRLNKISGGSQFVQVSLSGPDAVPVYTHNDRTVDIAVVEGGPPDDSYQYKMIPEEMITTRERFTQLNVSEGDEVFFTGLFSSFYGETRNYPIVRFGRVAMVTEERIPWEDQMLNLYLIECQSFGGNSGAPVFFYLSPIRERWEILKDSPRLLLAGIMKGSFLDARKIQLIDRSPIPIYMENAGIAAVVPAYQLHEILFSNELRKTRASST